MNEMDYEKYLNIQTAEFQVGFPKGYHYHRYEPTPYEALDQLFKVFQLPNQACCVDIGCGKGRVPIYLYEKFKVPTKGIEMNEKFFNDAQLNKVMYMQKKRKKSLPIEFMYMLGEDYNIQHEDNVFFFFNPFSVHIFRKIVANILKSYEQYPRTLQLILYYPSLDFLTFLNQQVIFKVKCEVSLGDVKNENERIVVFELNY